MQTNSQLTTKQCAVALGCNDNLPALEPIGESDSDSSKEYPRKMDLRTLEEGLSLCTVDSHDIRCRADRCSIGDRSPKMDPPTSHRDAEDAPSSIGGLLLLARPLPKSILRRPAYPSRQAKESIEFEDHRDSLRSSFTSTCSTTTTSSSSSEETNQPTVHIASVHFADGFHRDRTVSPPSVVTDVRFRPRTHPDDVSMLFYSANDVRRFKREYRMVLQAYHRNLALTRQAGHGQGGQQPQHPNTNGGGGSPDTTHHPRRPTSASQSSPGWRSRISTSGRWYGGSSGGGASVAPSSSQYSSTSSSVGLISSVFDAAKEAVSSIGRDITSPPYPQAGGTKSGNGHLVDTLYLF